jgi:hypothetical protein
MKTVTVREFYHNARLVDGLIAISVFVIRMLCGAEVLPVPS